MALVLRHRLPYFESLTTIDQNGMKICRDGNVCDIKHKCPYFHPKLKEVLKLPSSRSRNRNNYRLRIKINQLILKYWPVRNGTHPIYASVNGFSDKLIGHVTKELEEKGWKVWFGSVREIKLMYII